MLDRAGLSDEPRLWGCSLPELLDDVALTLTMPDSAPQPDYFAGDR